MNGNGSWKSSLIHAGIAAGAAIFGALSALLAAQVALDRFGLEAALVAGGVAFFSSLIAPSTNRPPPAVVSPGP